MTLTAKWIDRGREPQCAPDPDFPYGRFIDATHGQTPFCERALDCPTPRCGYWLVVCDRCKFSIVITTAGRPDDPCKIRVPCKKESVQ